MLVLVAWLLLINRTSVVFLYVSTSGLVPASKYNMNSMVFLYVSTSGLVPASKNNMNSMVFLYVSTSGLVPAYKCKRQAPEPQSFSLQECN